MLLLNISNDSSEFDRSNFSQEQSGSNEPNASNLSNICKRKNERKTNKNQKIIKYLINFYSYNILQTGYIFGHNIRFNVSIEHVHEPSILTNQCEIDVENSLKSF